MASPRTYHISYNCSVPGGDYTIKICCTTEHTHLKGIHRRNKSARQHQIKPNECRIHANHTARCWLPENNFSHALTTHHGLHIGCVPASQIDSITAGRSDPVEDVTHIRHPEHIPVANRTTNNKSTCASTKVRCAVVKSYASFGHLKHLLFVGRIVAIGCYICRQRGLISVCAVRKGW